LELFRIASVLEIHHEVIGESRQICLSLTRRPDLLFEPEIENEMQVDIGQDRTDRTALRRPCFRSRDNSSHHELRIQPFADQAQDERVCNPMSNHLLQPIVLDVVKISTDVGLEQVSYLLRDDDPA